jgi:hypothetical protein
MNMNLPDMERLRLAAMAFAAALMLFATACGGDETPPQCTFGVAEDGECVNADECLVQADCLAGYSCQQGTCQADQECSADADCDAGVCGSSGVCVNPSSCESNADCVSKTYCGDNGECIPDPCVGISCNRGTCEPGTGECTSKTSCTKENELFDCVQGEKCADGTCVGQDDYCDQITCERGVCSFEDGGCVAADDCAGEDSNCLDGQYCADDGSCRQDLCQANDVTCDQGVCVPAVGQCRNATSCESNADCVEDHLCVDNTCELESIACGDGQGDGGCTGSKICEYDESALTATCVESDTCETSLDCNDGRQCGGDTCVAPASCTPDNFEPNDAESEATDLMAAGNDQRLEADLCSSDVDHYVFDTNSFEPALVRGVLTITVDYADRDVGLGELSVELLREQADGSFASVDSDSAGPDGVDGKVVIEEELSASEQGVYMVKISGDDNLADAGVTYSLDARLLDDVAAEACNAARTIEGGQILTADYSQAVSTIYQSSCLPEGSGNPQTEQMFRFELEESARVSIDVTPEADEGEDAVVSLRRACASPATELACANDTTEGAESVTDQLLEPGTYYAMVESAPGSNLTNYEISFERRQVPCSSASNVCNSSSESTYCIEGVGTQTTTCTNDCDPTYGLCNRIDGDRCSSTTAITSAGSQDIEWGELRDDYQVAAESCVPEVSGNVPTSGKDRAFAVTVPTDKVLAATLTMASGEQGSVYVVEDCTDIEGTCAAGNATDSDSHTAYWDNRSGADKTVYVIADTAAGQALTTATLDIAFEDIVCDPASAPLRCDPNDATKVQACSNGGAAFVEAQACAPWDCSTSVAGTSDPAACKTPDTCQNVVDVTAEAKSPGGKVINDDWSNGYTNAAGGDGCGVGGYFTSDTGYEDFFVSVSLAQDETVMVNHSNGTNSSGDSPSPTLALQPSCGDLSDSTCLAGDAPFSGAASVSYTATDAAGETVYVHVDKQDSELTPFELDVRVRAACDPASFTPTCNSGMVEYCNSSGMIDYVGCGSGTCSSGTCSTPTADFCYGAENITQAAKPTGGTDITVDWSQYTNQFELDEACDDTFASGEIDGNDAYYLVDLVAGEALTASVDPGTTGDDTSLAIVAQDDCTLGDATGTTCLDAQHSLTISSVSYTATTSQSVYLIVDNDSPSTTNTAELNVDITSTCNPASFATTCQSGDVEYCTADGYTTRYGCDSAGCTSGTCSTATGDFCFDAIDITSASSASTGTSRTIDFTQFSNDWRVEGSCEDAGGNVMQDYEIDGSDAYYRVDLTAGQWLVASMESSDSDDPALSVVSEANCEFLNEPSTTCLTADDDSDTARVTYEATSDETVYLIADNDTPGSTDTFTLETRIAQPCDPATFNSTCSGTSVQYCNSQGYEALYSCGSGCTAGECSTSNGEFCFDAIDITTAAKTDAGDTRTIDPANFVNDYEVADSCSSEGISDFEIEGSDAYYRVDMLSGEALLASLASSGDDDPALIVTSETGCASLNTPAGTCLDADDDYNEPASVFYKATSDETVYLVADNDEAGSTNTFDLTTRIRPGCDTTSFGQTCDGDQVVYCANAEYQKTFDCGSGGCSSGACSTNNGEFCYDAIDLTSAANADGGTTEQVNFSNFTNDFGADELCADVTDGEVEGNDAYYRFDLQANDQLSVSLDNGSSSVQPALTLVPLDECNLAAGGGGTCLAGDDSYGTAELTYTADSAETVILIADNDDASSGATFTMDAQIQEACDSSFSRTCRGSEVAYCVDGLVETYDCGAGNCSSGTCTSTSNNYCFDAEDITSAASMSGGTSIDVDFSTLSNESPSEYCGFDSAKTVGPDAYYRVDLQAGETLDASLSSGSSTADPALGVIFDCFTQANTCLASDTQAVNDAQVSYFAPVDTTVYLVADSDSASNTDTFTLTAEVTTSAACTPGNYTTTCSGSDLTYCGLDGQTATHTCSGGCTSGSCDSPDGDTCEEAVDITSQASSATGFSQVETLDNASNDYEDLSPGSNCPTVVPDETAGKDIFYYVDLAAGETLTATADTEDSFPDPTIYFVPFDTCGSALYCLAGEHMNDGVASATYTASGSERVAIAVDTNSTGDTDVTVTAEIN